MNALSIVTTWRGCVVLGLILGSLGCLSGCLPSRILIDLDPPAGEIESTTVLKDDGASGTGHVALIDVTGVIAHVATPGAGENAVDSLVARLDQAERSDARAVILRINSPGGTVAATESMYRELVRFRERTGIPVVVSMSEVAASGGYYLSLGADHVVAQSTTITGSIGVIMQTVNLSGAMQKLGISARSVTSGPNKAMASPFEPEQEAHYGILQGIVDRFYADFRDRVAQGRNLSPEELDRLADGRVFTGSQAREEGLVDEVGDLHAAWEAAKRLAGVQRSSLRKYHTAGRSPRSAYARSAGGTGEGGTTINLLSLDIGHPSEVVPAGAGFYYLWVPGTE